ncbi:hypothetical protein PRIPAC_91451 [Pristionchus pacificus]|uniref:Uncharacterized protein n=1 Tax=Pristionchus pacificus TaxID=54126 RepID=A0A2A6BYZ6_PRIPA|nr:hypothetical protein PRIPAC_91451 [Pristionchus pacificus]|eukprot:PDM71089.1 hypothetical protein PRIPAC_44487 [Pristionchus pacificus]
MAPPTTKKTQRKAVADPKKDETPARASLSDTSTAPYEEGEYRVKEYLDVKMKKYKGRPEEPHFLCSWVEDPTPSWTPCRHASPKNPENRAGVLLMLRKLFKANPSLDLDPAIIEYFQSKNLDWRMARSFGRQGITDLNQKKPVVKKPVVEDKDSEEGSEEDVARGRAVERKAAVWNDKKIKAAVVDNMVNPVAKSFKSDDKTKNHERMHKGSRSPPPPCWSIPRPKYVPRLLDPDNSFSACQAAREQAAQYAPPNKFNESDVLNLKNEVIVVKKKSQK